MDVFTAISIFTGYDGIGLGLQRTIPNFRTICYVEREIFPVCNLVAKIKEKSLDDAPIWDDITTFDGKPFAGMADIIHAGIPCQPWSNAGKQEGIEDERWIWADVFRVIVEVKPNYIFLEEVPGFVRGGGLGYVLSDLAEAGYDADWGCFTAAETGAPHKRERLFILAYTEGMYANRDTGELSVENEQQTTKRPQGRTAESGSAGDVPRVHEAKDGQDPQGRSVETGNIRGILDTDGGSRKELGNTQKLRLERQRPQGREQVESDGTSEALENTQRIGRRGRDNGEPGRQGRTVQVEGSGELADSRWQRVKFADECVPCGMCEEPWCQECEDHYADCKCPGPTQDDEYEYWEKDGTLYAKKLADTESERTQGDGAERQQKPDTQIEQRVSGCDCRGDRWPARPGQPQYDWEEPRTVKSGMGRTVDGFKSRVDELRLLGNGVVPQTAELAFRTLWNKIT